MTGRLADGVSIEQAQAALDVIAHQLGREYFQDQPEYGIRATPLTGFDESMRAPIAALVGVLLVVAALVFAGVNVSYVPARRAARTDPMIALRTE